MKVIRTSSNYVASEHVGEFNSSPSQTIPDQTIPIRKLLENYTRGALPLGKKPYWDEEETVDVKMLDLVDIQELSMNSRKVLDDYNQDVKRREEVERSELEDLRKFRDEQVKNISSGI